MVWTGLMLLCKQQVEPAIKLRRSTFLDRLHLVCRGGAGGSGFPKINGVGGHGGNVFIEVGPEAKLEDILREYPDRHVKAGAGGNSARHQLLGKNGTNVTVTVPAGVTVVGPHNNVLADLVEPGQGVLVAKGGEGGNMRNHFAGRKGSLAQLSLFLKLIADIGFVGFPNAGKSTLLRALSRARPKVADYPFTTIKPNIGIMEYPDFRRISCADLPGLIEGAHQNMGLGHSFLRHVERTSLLLFVVDIGGFRLSPSHPQRDAYETVMSLNKELELYNDQLLSKPAVLIVNKMDTDGADEKLAKLNESLTNDEVYAKLNEEVKPRNRIQFRDTIAVVARNSTNVEVVKESLRRHLDDLHEETFKAREPIEPLILEQQLM